MAEGYVKNTSGALSYVFQYKDHLGNIRLTYAQNPTTQVLEIIEENNYYPFGLKHKGYNDYVATNNKYKYNNKEFQDELGLNFYDYGARNYDPALGRWMNIDPLAEQMRRHSPYNYAFNNPIYFIDPDGMAPTDDYGLDKLGKIELIKKTDDETDTLFTASRDKDGTLKKDENAESITVEKGVLNTVENTEYTNPKTGEKTDVQLLDASKTADSNKLFEFMSNNSINEFSLSKFENGTNIIGTSFKESSELSLNISLSRNNNLISFEHNHPMDFDGIHPSPADIQTAGMLKSRGLNVNLRVYAPLLKQYKKYDENSVSVELQEIIIPSRKSKK